MKARIAVLPGDGIGPEVTAAAVSVLRHVAAHHGHEFEFSDHLIGGCAIDAHGDPLPAETLIVCKQADAVLLGAVGGPQWSDPKAKLRPEQGLLRLRAELGLGPQPLVGLFGRLSEWKGQHVFLDAIAAMEGVQAVIVGGALFGQEAYEARIREQASRLGLEGRVRFLGFRPDVPELMAAMDVVAHTSIVAEPFGRVVVEAMMCGRPVVATRGGGVTEIIRDGETGLLVPPGDASALAAAIGCVLSQPALAERLAQKGREDVSQRFSLEETCRSVSALLSEAAADRRSG